jgi:hypothetical protein
MVTEITQHKKNAFLEVFAKIGNVTRAAQAVGISRKTHYDWLDDDEQYRKQYEESLETFKESLNFEVFRRGVIGVDEPVVYQGQISRDANGHVVTTKRYSDTLLIVKLKQMGLFVDRQEHAGYGGGPIDLGVRFFIPDNRRDQKALDE